MGNSINKLKNSEKKIKLLTTKTIKDDNTGIFDIIDNKFYYKKFYVTVDRDPTYLLPTKCKIILNNHALQIKKKKTVYLHIPYEEISSWNTEYSCYWAFKINHDSPLYENIGNKLFRFYMDSYQASKLSKWILSFTLHLLNKRKNEI